MARILTVSDRSEWWEAVREALTDQYVDLAASLEQTLVLLRTGAAYDLAVVDFPLDAGDGRSGDERGKLLELLWTHYPGTRRVVVAAVPSQRSGRPELFFTYGVEEVLAKSMISAPDLRRIVQAALEHEQAVEAPIRRAELRRRYQEWRIRQSANLQARIRTAELVARNIGRVDSASGRRAQAALDDALALGERFTADVSDTGIRIERAVTVLEILDAADSLAHIEDMYPEVGKR